MSTTTPNRDALNLDPRWRDLYRVGGITCLLLAVSVILAIAAFFVWPYAPGEQSTAEIFDLIQNDPLGGLMALDFFLLVGGLLSVVLMLVLYVALKQVSESYALLALVLGVLSGAAVLVSRPIAELFTLSSLYAAAADAEKGAYLAAGEALLPVFHGTAWIMYTILNASSFLISALLMLRSDVFGRPIAYLGLVTAAVTFTFFLPEIGPLLLFIPTVTSIPWNLLMARRFFQLGQMA